MTDKPIKHGTVHAYREHKCRCEPCVKANYANAKQWRNNARNRPTPESVHGSINGYSIYGCRCGPCKAASTAARRRLVERRRQMRETLGLP